MKNIRSPRLVPRGWQPTPEGSVPGIYCRTKGGLVVLLSIEDFDAECSDPPPMGLGTYYHISLSREGKNPDWEEMRDFIYKHCPFISSARDVVMLLPPTDQYVNVHQHCFHFYQKWG